jgi:hypothetical protein
MTAIFIQELLDRRQLTRDSAPATKKGTPPTPSRRQATSTPKAEAISNTSVMASSTRAWSDGVANPVKIFGNVAPACD